MKNLGTKTIDNILGETFTEEQRENFPLKQKLAFHHPIRSYILVFLGGEMPNLIKKLVNGLENRGTKTSRDLVFRGQKLSRFMLRKVWECSHGSFGEMRINKNILEHYQKNPHNRMQVWLAAQVLSQTQLCLIDSYAKECVEDSAYASQEIQEKSYKKVPHP